MKVIKANSALRRLSFPMLFLGAILALPCQLWAACSMPASVDIQYPPLVINNGQAVPMHSPEINSELTWTASTLSPIIRWDTCTTKANSGTAVLLPTGTPVSGVSYSDNYGQYEVFDIPGIPGIGYILRVKAMNTDWVAVGPGKETVILNMNTNQISTRMAVSVSLYAYGGIASGTYTIPQSQLASWGVRKPDGTLLQIAGQEWIPVNVSSTSVQIDTIGCSVTSPAMQTATLPTVSSTEFSGPGSSPPATTAFQFSLTCPTNVALYATMSDASSPGNTGDTLNLTADSTAKGIGVQIFRSGQSTPVSFGPDSPMAGNINQWYVMDTGRSKPVLSFDARYIQTEETIVPGKVNAVATITFSYQ